MVGVGLVCPLGLDLETAWGGVMAGRCGMGKLSALEQELPEGRDGGQAPELPGEFAPGLPREARYLRWAILAAMRDAGLDGGAWRGGG